MSAAAIEPVIARRPILQTRLDEDAVKVVRRLVRFGHQAYLVGGCVRDLLLGYRPKDFDVATSARPPELRKLFRNCRIIGRRFRLAHMLFRDGKVIEVATFRREPEVSCEEGDLLLRQDNVFGEPAEDALRRDFTINGLFYDVAPGTIIDYVGGLSDVERRLLRTIGDAEIRVQEDPVRILRAIKFTARQNLGLDVELYRSCVRHRGLLARSAPPRVFEEVLRLLRGGSAHRSFWLAREMGVLAEVLPELDRHLSRRDGEARRTWLCLQALDAMAACGRLPSDPVLLAALLRGLLDEPARTRGIEPGRAAEEAFGPLAERLVVPRRIRDRIRQVLSAQRRLAEPGSKGRARLAQREFYADALDLRELDLRASGAPAEALAELRGPVPAAAGSGGPRRRSRAGPRWRR